ncbi:MAG TPA: [FeFe] hydrogenase H-cluster maturation GTPase HydF [Polyangiaceae bacterium]|nr:[FeFe] hydrogenase H-cluster maturation GTPase HydF [Polyangiaceae bacterium]
MSSLDKTPTGERLHISIFGRRNAGKSSLVNALTGQPVAIVSEVAGTTTDPVAKAMEILPLGPVVLTDTAGIDDVGELGGLRVERSLKVLDKTDLALLVVEAGAEPAAWEDDLAQRARERQIPVVVVASKTDLHPDASRVQQWARTRELTCVPVSSSSGQGVDALREALVREAPKTFAEPTIVGDLLTPGDVVVMVVPIDKAAPKGRLILPQVMTIRDVLDHDASALVVKERELRACLDGLKVKPRMVITDSQAFLKVAADTPSDVWMTSFSILMARYKGDLVRFAQGARALRELRVGDRVLVSEGCSHHRQGDDIGTVQIPRWLRQMVGGDLQFGFSSGLDFPQDLGSYRLAIHCGACTLNRREVLHRQREASVRDVPMTNYGVCLAAVHGILDRALEPFPEARLAWKGGGRSGVRRKLKMARAAG